MTPSEDRSPWADLTVEQAEEIRDFYCEVVGWQPSAVEMGGYSDFNMSVPGAAGPQAGICHARGANAGLPAS
jgi:predicted enzyme related to lactoylglutathione lyase